MRDYLHARMQGLWRQDGAQTQKTADGNQRQNAEAEHAGARPLGLPVKESDKFL